MRLSCLDEVERWLLSWGTHATVISPLSLSARIHSIAGTLVQRCPNGATAEPDARASLRLPA